VQSPLKMWQRAYVRVLVFVCVCECMVVGKKIGINRIDQINTRKLLRTLQYCTVQEDTVRYGTEEKKRKGK
jgi:hypothetical protein